MDAAGFAKNESFEAVMVNDVATGRRCMVACFRKSEICQCGCRGQCTWWPIQQFLKHEFNAAANGRWVGTRSDNVAYGVVSARGRRAGKMGQVIAVTEIRADWPEFTAPLGLRTSAHKLCGCPVCTATKEQMGNLDDYNLEGGPAYELFDYHNEVAKHMVTVQIQNEEDRDRVLGARLEYDRSKTTTGGVCVGGGFVLPSL